MKLRTLLSVSLCILIASIASAQSESCDCPKPANDQIIGLALSVYNKEYSIVANKFSLKHNNYKYNFNYTYHDELWAMACVNPEKDSLEVIFAKVRCMWSKYRMEFVCKGYPTSIATGKNILKFAMDVGSSVFVLELAKRYKVDMNFIDPADGKTILDFITDRIAYFRNDHPREGTSEAAIKEYETYNESRIREYQRIYDLLRSQGVKHAREF